MHLYRIFLYSFIFVTISGYILPPSPPSISPSKFGRMPDDRMPQKPTKIQEYIKLTRIDKNAIPVTVLNCLSGIVTNPTYWRTWITSSPFLYAFSMVHLITAASMILNDLNDIETDKINNPSRPLVSGTVTIKEAIGITGLLLGTYSYLGTLLPKSFEPIWLGAMGVIVLYTPVLKRITIIKNLACSGVVSMAVPFVGLTTLQYWNDISPWLGFTTQLVFCTSIFIELLLDIGDIPGDKKAGIMTIPVLIGPERTLNCLFSFSLINYFYSIFQNTNPIMILNSIIVFLPQFCGVIGLKKFITYRSHTLENDVKDKIKQSIRSTTIALLAYSLVYILFL